MVQDSGLATALSADDRHDVVCTGARCETVFLDKLAEALVKAHVARDHLAPLARRHRRTNAWSLASAADLMMRYQCFFLKSGEGC